MPSVFRCCETTFTWDFVCATQLEGLERKGKAIVTELLLSVDQRLLSMKFLSYHPGNFNLCFATIK